MAQFFITNSKDFYTRLNERVEKTVFEKSLDYSKDGLYALAWQPMMLSKYVSYMQGDSWCIVSGVCVVKTSAEAKQILETFSNDIEDFRAKALGQYAIAVCKEEVITIAGDPVCCLDIYYYHKDDLYLVSNSLYDMVWALQDRVSLDYEKIIQEITYRTLWSNETLYDEIQTIRGNQVIEIKNNIFDVKTINVDLCDSNISRNEEDIRPVLAEQLKSNAMRLTAAIGIPTIMVTGGLDSRLVLATFLSAGIKPRLLYIRGSHWCDSQDEYIAQQFATAYGLQLEVKDAREYETTREEYEHQVHNHGFDVAYSWGGNAKTFENIAKKHNCLLPGLGGELYRNMTDISSRDEFIQTLYHFNPNRETIETAYPQVQRNFIMSLQKEISQWGLREEAMGQDGWYFMQIIARSKRDMLMSMLYQHYGYMYCPLFDSTCLKLLTEMQKKDGSGSSFQLRLILNLCPDILQIPVFSRRKEWYLDEEHMTLTLENPQLTKIKSKSLLYTMWNVIPLPIRNNVFKPIRRAIFNRKRIPSDDNVDTQSVGDSKTQLFEAMISSNTGGGLFQNTFATGWEDYTAYCMLMLAIDSLKQK